VRQIERDIEHAATRAEIGSPVIGLPSAYRKVRSGPHRVIYRLVGAELVIIRILHERQDVPDEIEDFW
jgi:plasmid stabilization system protein ParE